ncbi:MAG: hypothetical protein AAFN41_01635 [Planctomycetota bacterium]
MRHPRTLLIALAATLLNPAAAAQQPPPDYGHNFITIGDVGNVGYTGLDPFNVFTGRGTVDYEYRISRTEVTSG